MDRKRIGDPKDGAKPAGERRFVPGHGMGFLVPSPITAGRPKPEPEDRWTLGPGRREEPPEGDKRPGAAAPAGPHALDEKGPEPPAGPDVDPAVEGVPVEPVRARVSNPAREEGEADPF